jgi:glycyl-tRNA synthetase
LRNHEAFSGKKLQVFDPESNSSYIPYVVETSVGLDRLFLAVLSTAYDEETLADGSVRTVLHLPAALAPTKAAVLPLVKKDGLPELAHQLLHSLKFEFQMAYDEKDAIGRRYRRQDALGTPICITVDHESLTDGAATLRYRDTMHQERLPFDAIPSKIREMTSMEALLKQL